MLGRHYAELPSVGTGGLGVGWHFDWLSPEHPQRHPLIVALFIVLIAALIIVALIIVALIIVALFIVALIIVALFIVALISM
eukprot:jgi/Ulvmu1/2503/UM138_0007.1